VNKTVWLYSVLAGHRYPQRRPFELVTQPAPDFTALTLLKEDKRIMN